MKKIVRRIFNFGYWAILILLGLIAIFLAASTLNLPNGYKFYTVQSGSMLPAIKIGSLVIIKKSVDYRVGEVITFKTGRTPITHRLLAIKDSIYITKGDANNSTDTEPVQKYQILGKVIFSLPYLGYPVAFAKTKEGFIGLIVIPATIIVYSEILNIKKEITKLRKKLKSKK